MCLKSLLSALCRRSGNLFFLLIAPAALIILSAAPVAAAPGDLDTTFNQSGFASLQFPLPTRAQSVIFQPDGKIIAAGGHVYDSIGEGCDFALARYHPNGTLDTSFGIDGKVVSRFISQLGSDFINFVEAALQGDGKIVAVGHFRAGDLGLWNLLVVRYNADGSLDTTFDGDGIMTMRIDNYSLAGGIAAQPDGKVVISASAGNGFTTVNPYRFMVIRIAGGGLDPTFGDGGVVQTAFNGIPSRPFGIAVQANGKIVVAGLMGNNNYALARYLPNGTPDATFGNSGTATLISGVNDTQGADVVVQPDGKIILLASVVNRFQLFRAKADGTPDPTFGASGGIIIAQGNHGEERAGGLTLQPDGKIIAGGYSYSRNNSTIFNPFIVRLNPDGYRDPTFGAIGHVYQPANMLIYDVAIQPSDGKLVAVGSFGVSAFGYRQLAVARYQTGIAAVSPAKVDFDADGTSDFAVTRANDSNYNWYALSNNYLNALLVETEWGLITDKITPADYDGDNKTDVAVFRPSDGNWYILKSSDKSIVTVHFGQSGDIPLAGDFDGDGRADTSVYRSGNWYILNSSNGQFRAEQFGIATDKPVLADFDGDRKTDLAVYRDGVWYAQRSTAGFFGAAFGLASDKPLPGDYDGDGKSDLAVYRPSDGTWYLQNSTEGFKAFQFGIATDLTVPADYNGDGKTDIAVFREGVWYILNSNGSLRIVYFGYATDKPLQTAFQQ
jgi:uncharacterized delta-60 repeat protein